MNEDQLTKLERAANHLVEVLCLGTDVDDGGEFVGFEHDRVAVACREYLALSEA